MNELEKLEYIHHVLQEVGGGYVDLEMIEKCIEMVEDMRKPLLNKQKKGLSYG